MINFLFCLFYNCLKVEFYCLKYYKMWTSHWTTSICLNRSDCSQEFSHMLRMHIHLYTSTEDYFIRIGTYFQNNDIYMFNNIANNGIRNHENRAALWISDIHTVRTTKWKHRNIHTQNGKADQAVKAWTISEDISATYRTHMSQRKPWHTHTETETEHGRCERCDACYRMYTSTH